MRPRQGSLARHSEFSLSHGRKVIFSLIVLSLVIFLIYANSFDGSWQFDDIPNITENPKLHINDLSWSQIKVTFFSDQRHPQNLYRPVACFSFALNHLLGGLNVFGYHIVNTIIHWISSVFLFLFLYNTLNLPSLRSTYAESAYSVAILATFFWAINPVQTQAVTYIVQRMASMAGMFYVISMFLYLKARTSTKVRIMIQYHILCLISFLLALGSKENAVMLPISLLLFETLIIQEDTGKFLKEHWKAFIMVLAVTLLAGMAYLYWMYGNILFFLSGYDVRPFTISERLLTEPRVILFYMALLLYPVPHRLSVAHPIEVSTSLFSPISTFISVVLIVAMIAYLIFKAKRHPLFSFCLLFFFLNHLAESSVFPLELIFEHRNYIPSMFFFVPLAIGVFWLLERYAARRTMKVVLSAFVVFLLVGFGHATFLRNFAWKDTKSLWMDALEKAPNQFRVHHNLGVHYQKKGQNMQAIAEFEKALSSPGIHRRDEKIITYYHLGRLYNDLADYDRAKSFYQKALQLDPHFPHAMANLVSIYDREGNSRLAEEYLFKALASNPGDPSINFNMGLYQIRRGSPQKAIGHFIISMRENRLKPKALLYLGIASKQKGSLGKAVTYFRESAAADSKNITPHLHLAEIFLRKGNEAMSRKEAQKAVKMMLSSEELFYQTADLISGRGHLKEVQLSAELLLPLINEVCEEEVAGLQERQGYLKRVLERKMRKQ